MILILAVAFVVSLLLYAVCAGSETALYSVSRLRIAIGAERGDRLSRALDRVLADPAPLLVSILLLQNLAHEATTILAAFALDRAAIGDPVTLSVVLLTPILLLVGDAVPKVIVRQRPEGALRKVFRGIEACHRVLAPFGAALRGASRVVSRAFHRGGASDRGVRWSREGLEELLFEGANVGTLTHLQRGMAIRVLRMSGTPIRSVARPLDEMLQAPDDMMVQAFLRKATARGAREAILFRGGLGGSPERELRILDVLLAAPGTTLLEASKPLARLPAELPVDRAIARLQRARTRVGLVVDPAERPVGFVTIRTLVEEVVGELEPVEPPSKVR